MSAAPTDLASTITDARLSVLDSHFRRLTSEDEPASEGAIQVDGRLHVDLDEPGLIVHIKLRHAANSVAGEITTALQYKWEGLTPTRSEIVEFARLHGVANALPATSALFGEGFLRFGVRMSFPPPLMAPKIAEVLCEDALKEE